MCQTNRLRSQDLKTNDERSNIPTVPFQLWIQENADDDLGVLLPKPILEPKSLAATIKIDALFKPLLRKFRGFIRDKFFGIYDQGLSHRHSPETKLNNI